MNKFGGYEEDDIADWGQENIEQGERDLDNAIAEARKTPDEMHDALVALIGLVQGIGGDAVKDTRYLEARTVAKAYL